MGCHCAQMAICNSVLIGRCARVNKSMSILENYWAVNVTTLSVSVNVILCRSRKLSPASSRLGLTSSVPCSCLCVRCPNDKTSAWNKAQTLELFTAHIKDFLYAHNIFFRKTQNFFRSRRIYSNPIKTLSPVHQRVIQTSTFDIDERSQIFWLKFATHTCGDTWQCVEVTKRRTWAGGGAGTCAVLLMFV